MAIQLHPHAKERMTERGVSEKEVIKTVEEGELFPAKFGRTGFRHNFAFERIWRGKWYRVKQVEICAVREQEDWVIITVVSKYF